MGEEAGTLCTMAVDNTGKNPDKQDSRDVESTCVTRWSVNRGGLVSNQ